VKQIEEELLTCPNLPQSKSCRSPRARSYWTFPEHVWLNCPGKDKEGHNLKSKLLAFQVIGTCRDEQRLSKTNMDLPGLDYALNIALPGCGPLPTYYVQVSRTPYPRQPCL
jgi:hypothetical protein